MTVAASANAAPYTPSAGKSWFNGHTGTYTLGGDWYFLHDPSDRGRNLRLQKTKNFAAGGWSRVSIPNAWNATDFSESSYVGSIGWYGTEFRAPRVKAGTKWVMRFESVNYAARVWLNGREIGRHKGAYVPFELPAQKLKRGVNRLVVRVDSRLSDNTVPAQEERSGQVTGGWWNYSGILREVLMRPVRNVDLRDLAVRPRQACPKCNANIEVIASLKNLTRAKQTIRLTGNYGGTRIRFKRVRLRPRGAKTVVGRVVIRKPRTWSPLSPSLYAVSIGMSGRGGALAGYRMRSGIRTLKPNSKGAMLLNGRSVQLSGISFHEADPVVGAAWTPAVRNQYLGWVKELGANLIRSHYPLHPAMMEWADRNGVLVWSQAPVYRPRDNLLKRKSYRAASVRAVREMVLANRSHPSVMVWSLINEPVVNTHLYLYAYTRDAWKAVKKLDPRGLTAIDVASSPRTDLQHPSYRKVEVLGLNQYFGWYPGGAGLTKDKSAFGPYADSFHNDYPKQALFVTEFGAEANHDGPADELGSFDYQTNFFIYHLREIHKKSYVNGMVAWLLRDYPVRPDWAGGNPDPSPPFGAKGLIDVGGAKKPAFDEVARVFHARPPFK
jgi:beta-glucuronidase